MSDQQFLVRERNAAWWVAHPDFRVKYKTRAQSADSLARSVVHWHHNVESARRHRPDDVVTERYFGRRYAIAATQAWLVEAQDKLDALGTAREKWYERRDQEVLVRTLQQALDDFEYNGADMLDDDRHTCDDIGSLAPSCAACNDERARPKQTLTAEAQARVDKTVDKYRTPHALDQLFENKDEVGWLIESGQLSDAFGKPMYWCGGVRWDGDSLEAVRFSREIDARRVIAAFGSSEPFYAREHMWCPPST